MARRLAKLVQSPPWFLVYGWCYGALAGSLSEPWRDRASTAGLIGLLGMSLISVIGWVLSQRIASAPPQS